MFYNACLEAPTYQIISHFLRMTISEYHLKTINYQKKKKPINYRALSSQLFKKEVLVFENEQKD